MCQNAAALKSNGQCKPFIEGGFKGIVRLCQKFLAHAPLEANELITQT